MKLLQKHRGVLAFEWVLVCTLLIIGIIGGLAAARNAFLYEIDDTIEVVRKIDAKFVETPETQTNSMNSTGSGG